MLPLTMYKVKSMKTNGNIWKESLNKETQPQFNTRNSTIIMLVKINLSNNLSH